MKIAYPKTPKPYDPDVITVCDLLCNETPKIVPIRISPHSEQYQCWQNVIETISRHGGESVFGWLITIAKPLHIETLFHSVWRSPIGDLIDVTPPQFEFQSKDSIVFVEDKNYVFPGIYDQNGEPSQMPAARVFPLGCQRIWKNVAELMRVADALRMSGKEYEGQEKSAECDDLIRWAMAGHGVQFFTWLP